MKYSLCVGIVLINLMKYISLCCSLSVIPVNTHRIIECITLLLPSDPCEVGGALSAAVVRRAFSLCLLLRMCSEQAAIGMGGTYHLPHLHRGGWA